MAKKKRHGRKKANIGIAPIIVAGRAIGRTNAGAARQYIQNGNFLAALDSMGTASNAAMAQTVVDGLMLGVARSAFGSIPLIRSKKFTLSVLG